MLVFCCCAGVDGEVWWWWRLHGQGRLWRAGGAGTAASSQPAAASLDWAAPPAAHWHTAHGVTSDQWSTARCHQQQWGRGPLSRGRGQDPEHVAPGPVQDTAAAEWVITPARPPITSIQASEVYSRNCVVLVYSVYCMGRVGERRFQSPFVCCALFSGCCC